MSNDRWNLNRVGRASVATTVPGQVPAYGLAMDLGSGTAPYMTAEQYQDLMRDVATRTATQALQSDPAYQAELQRAQNLQGLGYALPNTSFLNANDDDEGWLERRANDVMTGVNMFKDAAGSLAASASTNAEDAARLIPIVGGYIPAGTSEGEIEDATYERYKLYGGILTQSDFEDFDGPTRAMLVTRAQGRKKGQDILGLPGIKQAATALVAAYQGVQTPFIMYGNNAGKVPVLSAIDPNWLQGGEWAAAWRESQDQSLGNALVNSVLEPYVGQERIDDWKRESAIYQLTSLGVEVGAAWVADPLVIAGKTGGAAARMRRGELPINVQSKAYRASTQALQRERVTVGGIAGQLGKYRARRMQTRWGDLEAFAKNNSYADFANLPMFRKRDIDGQPAAAALHWAFTNPAADLNLNDLVKSSQENGLGLNYPDIPSMTQQLLHGDPKAFADLNALKAAAPEELNKFAPGAQNFIDAIDATKTKIPSLTREIEELSKVEPKSKFHEWSVHTEIDQRVKDITEAEDALRKYEGYDSWLGTMNKAPSVSRVDARRGVFMESQYGRAHGIVKFTRPVWIKKANTAEIHDVDSGAESIRRQFQQFDHLFGYRNTEALDDSLMRWTTAPTAHDRYDVVREVEERHLIDAAAQKFDVDPGTVRAIYEKVVAEQNRVIEGIRRGAGSIYSSAPSGAQRLEAGDSNIKLVREDPESGMVEIELMEAGGRRTTVTVHESALQPKGQKPVDPTQTPNYYQPLDTRRFYLELKRNRELIADMNLSGLRTGKAMSAEVMDAVGTRFNALWKPAVLFRFGWPMRVLMDENMRALAVLGIPAFTRYYGGDYARAMNNAGIKTAEAGRNAFNALIHDPYVARKTGRKTMNIGPGPVAASTKRTMDPVAREEELLNAPRVPESFTPVLDNARYEKVAAISGAWDDFYRRIDKKRAWDHEYDRRDRPKDHVIETVYYGSDIAPTRAQQAAFGADDFPPRPVNHPMNWIRQQPDPFLKYDVPSAVAYDPIPTTSGDEFGVGRTTFRQEKSGYAVPLNHTKLSDAASDRERHAWYSKHRELLGSTGHRILMDSDGATYVARVFQNRQRRSAEAMAEFTEAGLVHNLTTGKSHPLKSWNDLSPTAEAAYKMFVSRPEVAAVPGDAPYGGPKRLEGPKTVLHGTYDELPEDLLPREMAPLMTGRMIGDGFYTTTNREVAEGFAMGGNLYTIRGSKDGRKYRIFDMDKVPSQAELKRLIKWVKANHGDQVVDDFKELVRLGQGEQLFRYYTHLSGPHGWIDYMAHLHTVPQAQRMLTRYLEETHNAGALTHQGGQLTGNSNRATCGSTRRTWKSSRSTRRPAGTCPWHSGSRARRAARFRSRRTGSSAPARATPASAPCTPFTLA